MSIARRAAGGSALVGLVCTALLAGPVPANAGPVFRLSASATTAKKAGTTERYRACVRTVAASSTTNLRPVRSIGAGNADDPAVGPIPYGVVRVEHATNLSLTDGRIGAGNGFDAATGGVSPVRVSDSPVVAPVSLVVLDSKASGRRVAFVEVRIKPARPVSWQLSNPLSFDTDGGDGGFSRGTAPEDDANFSSLIDAYVDAFSPHGDDYSGIVCVLRLAKHGGADAVLFETGYGDGYYPTFVGKDKTGAIVSVVSYDYVLPWRDAGLPGKAPKFDFTS